MASVTVSAESSLRLADQLQVLSQVAESLTYRLLELEERLAGQERLLDERLGSAQDPRHGEALDHRLDDTEERLARIETALQGLDRTGGVRHLQAVQPPAIQQDPMAAGGIDDDVVLVSEDLFIDEGEQPFMDELIA